MRFQKYLSYLNLNKYFIALFYLIIYITFFSDSNLISLFKKISYLNKIETRKSELQENLYINTSELYLLKNNVQGIEKYARENFMMKKDNEDLFIVKPAPENK